MKFQTRKLQKALVTIVGVTLLGSMSLARADDPVILSFTTVGDSRQDPINLDPSQIAQGGLTGQDAHWLENTKAWTRITRSIQ